MVKEIIEKQEAIDPQIIQSYEKHLKATFAQHDYADIFLITMDNTIAYALNDKSIINQNYLKYPHEEKELALAVNLSLATLSSQLSSFIVDKQSESVFIYLTQPILADNRLWGTLVLKINPKILLTNMTTTQSFGLTGEILLGNISETTKTYLIRPQNLLPSQQLPHDPKLFDASHGDTGMAITKDYRQNNVIAAWDYLAETNIGIVIKQDLNEILIKT